MGGTDSRQCRSAVKIEGEEGSVHRADGEEGSTEYAEVKVTAVETVHEGRPLRRPEENRGVTFPEVKFL